MKRFNQMKWGLCLSVLMGLVACQDEQMGIGSDNIGAKPIVLSGEIDQVYQTRANDNGFADGDVMGVYIVDYEQGQPGVLQTSGNRADNVSHTFDAKAYKWNSAFDIFWKDKTTPIDVYGYYPLGRPSDVNRYEFSIRADQSQEGENGQMGGYEASDFLWGKAENIAPTQQVVRLRMKHRMASIRLTLTKGEGITDDEWTQAVKQAVVHNTRRRTVIDLSTGEVRALDMVEQTGIIPYRKGNDFRAIVAPQVLAAGTTLFSISIDGVPYKFSKQEAFTYYAGKMHNFTIRIDKKQPSGEYQLQLVNESFTAWENDEIAHDAQMKAYVVIRSERGKLSQAIRAAKKDPKYLQNLKIKGEIDAKDFQFMRDSMPNLRALNLKEAVVWGASGYYDYNVRKGVIPYDALKENKTLTNLVLPDLLEVIGNNAFSGCTSLSGSLLVPEGCKVIEWNAFYQCSFLTGELSLPTTLEEIGENAFFRCKFNSPLNLPSNLKYIGYAAFAENGNYYGDLRLPPHLEFLGKYAFTSCTGLTGDLIIPESLKEIPQSAFSQTGLNGTLQLHDGITSIGAYAFSNSPLKGELVLPKELVAIGEGAFSSTQFSSIRFNAALTSIGKNAFEYSYRLMGVLTFPPGLQSIGERAFYVCPSIQGLVFPAALDNIAANAFNECHGIGSIVCQGSQPALVKSGAFNGVPKDNFTLEVPEAAVAQYQIAAEWREFKRIAAHHELVCRPSVATALNTEATRRLVLNAEGAWEVASMPDWCSLSQASGTQKTELTLTIQALAKGSGNREGEIVFRLKDKGYTHKLKVSQYDYQYGEDEALVIQRASKGSRGGINLVFMGDGYDAQSISEGTYLADMQTQIEHFFAIEPYKTYRDYFNVITAFPVSAEKGVGTLNTIRYTRFATTFTSGVGLKCDYDALFDYVLKLPGLTRDNLKESLIVMTPNSTDYAGVTRMWSDGSAVAFCPMSKDAYPFDARGIVQHEAGGHGFGKFGDEYIYHNAFIDDCDCICCPHDGQLAAAKALGWYDNLSLSGKMNEVPWSRLIFDQRYSKVVDIFEGGYMHSRSVFRSEQNSCMNNNVPYFSAISRMSIVQRIKRYAGEAFDFEEFVRNDKMDAAPASRSMGSPWSSYKGRQMCTHAPIIQGSPLDRKSSHRKK